MAFWHLARMRSVTSSDESKRRSVSADILVIAYKLL